MNERKFTCYGEGGKAVHTAPCAQATGANGPCCSIDDDGTDANAPYDHTIMDEAWSKSFHAWQAQPEAYDPNLRLTPVGACTKCGLEAYGPTQMDGWQRVLGKLMCKSCVTPAPRYTVEEDGYGYWGVYDTSTCEYVAQRIVERHVGQLMANAMNASESGQLHQPYCAGKRGGDCDC